MPNVFSAVEVMDMGIEKERKRRDFYGFAAAKFHNKEMKDLFSRLRDWEETHIKRFGEIRDSLRETEITESYQGEFVSYIKAAVDDMLYKQVTAGWFVKNVKDELTAIDYGMGFEKDAILFFSELSKYMEPQHREKIEEMVGEEKKHLIFLSAIRKKYA